LHKNRAIDEAYEKFEELAQVSGASSDEKGIMIWKLLLESSRREREEIERKLEPKIEQLSNILTKDDIVGNHRTPKLKRVGQFEQMPERLYIDEIDSFQKVRNLQPKEVQKYIAGGFINVTEDFVQEAIKKILDVPFHRKDWGGEINDLYTTNLIIAGKRRAAAFLLKGPGIGKKEMHIADCGKRGDQIVRLFETPADLFVVQYVGPIADLLIKDVQSKIEALKSLGKQANFLIIDGQDTARLLHAYGRLPNDQD
jgi:hypothetical protein